MEEEHAGGALAFPSYNLGMTFVPDTNLRPQGHTFEELPALLGGAVDIKPEGYGVDTTYPDIIYLPEDVTIELETQTASWTADDSKLQTLRILPDRTYLHPTGYKIHMEQHPSSGAWLAPWPREPSTERSRR